MLQSQRLNGGEVVFIAFMVFLAGMLVGLFLAGYVGA